MSKEYGPIQRIVSETDKGCILDCGHTYPHRGDCSSKEVWHRCKVCRNEGRRA